MIAYRKRRETHEQRMAVLRGQRPTADLRELLSAIQSALPDAADRPPGEVFRHALGALGRLSVKGPLFGQYRRNAVHDGAG